MSALSLIFYKADRLMSVTTLSLKRYQEELSSILVDLKQRDQFEEPIPTPMIERIDQIGSDIQKHLNLLTDRPYWAEKTLDLLDSTTRDPLLRLVIIDQRLKLMPLCRDDKAIMIERVNRRCPALVEVGRIDEALAEIVRGQDLYQDGLMHRYYYAQAAMLFQKGLYEAALQTVRQALVINKDDWAGNLYARVLEGACHIKQNDDISIAKGVMILYEAANMASSLPYDNVAIRRTVLINFAAMLGHFLDADDDRGAIMAGGFIFAILLNFPLSVTELDIVDTLIEELKSFIICLCAAGETSRTDQAADLIERLILRKRALTGSHIRLAKHG